MDTILKVIRLMSELSSEFIMKIKTAWMQKDIFIDNGINTYIQMELGLCDLSRFVNIQNNLFTKTNCLTLSPTRYEVSLVLFEQMLESLHYIHNDKRLGQCVSVERWIIGE